MAKAKKVTKKPRAKSRTASKRTTKRGSAAPKRDARKARRTKQTTAKKVRNRSSATAKEAAAGRMAGPSMPLRDLVRGGMPRSSKAHRGLGGGVVPAGPQARRRMKSAHGLRLHGGGIAQNVPRPLGRRSSTRVAIPKR